MGVQNDDNYEGSVFGRALNFHTENKDTDEQLRQLPESTGEGEKYIDGNILPNYKPSNERPSKIDYYLNIARSVAMRSTCLRRKYGSIIVKDDVIVSTGYNGAPRGRKNCTDIGYCYRQQNNIPSGSMYEACRSSHSEMNAIIFASKDEMKDATLYLVGIEKDGFINKLADCCSICKRLIINSGIKEVYIAKSCMNDKYTYTRTDVKEWIEHDDSLFMIEVNKE